MRAIFFSMAVVVFGAACTSDDATVDPEPSTCVPAAYRIDAVGLPRSGAAAAAIALDLDGDGTPDNRLGRLNATLAEFYADWRPDDRLSARLADDVAWFATVERCEGEVAIDLVAGHDDDGDGRFTLEPGGDRAIGDDLLATHGDAAVPIDGFTDPLGFVPMPAWVTARGVAVVLHAQDTGDDHDELDAVVDVGLSLDDDALEPVAAFLTHHLGDSVVARALDADHDATITVAELRASPTIAALIADDVDVLGGDGAPDRASLAFTLHARAARLE